MCLQIWNGAYIKIVALLGDMSDGLKLLLDFKSSIFCFFGKKLIAAKNLMSKWNSVRIPISNVLMIGIEMYGWIRHFWWLINSFNLFDLLFLAFA